MAREHQATERTMKAVTKMSEAHLKMEANNGLAARLSSEGDQRVELQHRHWLYTQRYDKDASQFAAFSVLRAKLLYTVQKIIRLLITMSDMCGCVNFPSRGGGGQALPPAVQSQMHRGTHTHTHLMTGLFFAAFREKVAYCT